MTEPIKFTLPTITIPMNFLKSKTFWGTIIAAFGYIDQAAQSGLLPPKVAAVITGLGAILAALGLRQAISKNGKGE